MVQEILYIHALKYKEVLKPILARKAEELFIPELPVHSGIEIYRLKVSGDTVVYNGINKIVVGSNSKDKLTKATERLRRLSGLELPGF